MMNQERSVVLNRSLAKVASVALLTLAPSLCNAQEAVSIEGDWPQWRGPQRSGVAPAFEPPESWPETLELVWQTEVGHSDASPVLGDGRLFVFVREGEDEVVKALDLSSGKEIWRSQCAVAHKASDIVGAHGSGPYATPLFHDGVLYTFGITEVLTAWDAATGMQLWQRDFDGVFRFRTALYGNSVSPLLYQDQVVVAVGGASDGALLAVSATTGEDRWRIAGDGPSYGSPVIATIGGVEQLVFLTQRRLVGVDGKKGSLLWEMPYKVQYDGASVTPLVIGDLVVVSATQKPVEAFRVSQGADGEWSVALAWANAKVIMEFSTPVQIEDKIIAFSSKNSGQLVALSHETGKILWQGDGRQGQTAFLIAQGNVVFATGEDGVTRVMEVAVRPAETVAEVKRYEVAESAVWNHPILLNQHLIIKDWTHVRVWRVATD